MTSGADLRISSSQAELSFSCIEFARRRSRKFTKSTESSSWSCLLYTSLDGSDFGIYAIRP